MDSSRLVSISDAASSLAVSEAYIDKFIKLGLVTPVKDGRTEKLTSYGFRRLMRIIDMYEKSFSTDYIETALNH